MDKRVEAYGRAADCIYLILGICRDKIPNEAVEALQGVAAALDADQEPAQAGSFVCERGGCGKNGRVDPYGAGPDCKSGGLSPAGSEPATATTIKPSAGGA